MSLLVARKVRHELGVDSGLVDARGRVVVPTFTIARRLAASLTRLTSDDGGEETTVTAGDLVALTILDDVFRTLVTRYLRQRDATTLSRISRHLAHSLGERETAEAIRTFGDAFGLRARSVGESDRDRAHADDAGSAGLDDSMVLEVVLFWLQLRNPAAERLVKGLHRGFTVSPAMRRLLAEVESFLTTCDGMIGRTLAEDLLAPISAHPASLSAQLAFVRRTWGEIVGDDLWRVQSALDLMAEETAPRWEPGGAPPVEAPGLPVDGEVQYALDRDWMPRLVLAAKNTLVWLHQLSVAYRREISRLDQVPESELELLAGRGITGLWLIGIWERSLASSEIKRRRGNPEAAASAYSLRGYRIADEFGGEEALEVLRRRAARHGVRLAADMVPNHMGIDSDWVLDHPGRFVQVRHAPFPAYSFTGPDLSPRPDVGIYLEDHYYDGTDAAVVFRRVDRASGEETFIYHGNDGTSMPWNDTAQLDYLNPEVREAVVETILDVARKFSVIRFDAAMTLAKRHYHRLWHPQPGDAGAVPSRSEHSLTREQLDQRMPREFWREVVDRISAEAPDTLLLAEAFWLMEGYFVRTLGLHRVYNSAFMHMMRDGETGKYRRLLKETLAFDPEILRRYVNFMSNPDEESAADQFDLGDRYFGVCTVLATLPGLPMFAHGQWDGLREKYGMEYRRSYREEEPVREVIERHDREIAPLLRRRARFAGVENFRLYDVVDDSGAVREEVLAYSNGRRTEASLVVFNNSAHPVRGRLSMSAPYRQREDGDLRTEGIADALPLSARETSVAILRDSARGVSVLSSIGRRGSPDLIVDVGSFASLVFDHFEDVEDSDGSWLALADHLRGRPVDDLALELAVYRASGLVFSLLRFADCLGLIGDDRHREGAVKAAALEAEVEHAAADLDLDLGDYFSRRPFVGDPTEGAHGVSAASIAMSMLAAGREGRHGMEEYLREPLVPYLAAFLPLASKLDGRGGSRVFEDRLVERLARAAPLDQRHQGDLAELLRLAIREQWLASAQPPGLRDLVAIVERWTVDPSARRVLRAHAADGVDWIVSEGLEALLASRAVVAGLVMTDPEGEVGRVDAEMSLVGWRLATAALRRTAALSEYRCERWRETLERIAAMRGVRTRSFVDEDDIRDQP